MSKRNGRKYNRNEQVLRTVAWAIVVIAFVMASHPATDDNDATVGIALAVGLAVALVATRDSGPRR